MIMWQVWSLTYEVIVAQMRSDRYNNDNNNDNDDNNNNNDDKNDLDLSIDLNSQISQCTYFISHNAPFRAEMGTFLF